MSRAAHRRGRHTTVMLRGAGLVVSIAVIAVMVLRVRPLFDPEREFAYVDGRHDRVVRVVGPTSFAIEGGTVVRLLGIVVPPEFDPDTAQAFLRESIEEATVELVFDRERRARDGQVLAFVHVDGECVNESLVAAGLARLDENAPFSSAMQRRFRKAEAAAREVGRGGWATRDDPGTDSHGFRP